MGVGAATRGRAASGRLQAQHAFAMPASHLQLRRAPSPTPPPPQVVLGSLAIVVGLGVGATTASRRSGALVAACYEVVRLPLVAGLIWFHRRENIAKP